VAAGAIVLHEPVTVATIVGFTLIIVGSVLATRGGKPVPVPEERPVTLRGGRPPHRTRVLSPRCGGHLARAAG